MDRESRRLPAGHGLTVPPGRLARDWSRTPPTDPRVAACWAEVYAAPDRHWDLYELAEKLVDLEYHLQLWRFGHLKTVERVIGFKRGTGGTAGVPYLAKVVEARLFPELLDVRTAL